MWICDCFWSLILILLVQYEIKGNLYPTYQQSPAKVVLRFSFTNMNQELTNEPRLIICIDKKNEKCFWSANQEINQDNFLYSDNLYKFYVNNMDTDLSISIKIENTNKTIQFTSKKINLKKIKSKDTFEIYSITLDNVIKMTVEHECEIGYYPPNQCNRVCHPVPDSYSCDDFGNKICKEGLYYNANDEQCVPNNCVDSKIKCYNNGRCINHGLTFECECLERFIGKFCEFVNPCLPNPCKNEGKCIMKPSSNSYNCSCPEGYSGNKCESRIYKRCNCPANMRCNYSELGVLLSCTVISSEEMEYKSPIPRYKENNENNQPIFRPAKQYNQNWPNVSVTTTIVAAVGCFMVILSISITVYVFHRTRNYSSTMKKVEFENSQSTNYTQFSPRLSNGTFKRSHSLDDNSAYIPVNPSIIANHTGLLTLGSSNGYSIHSNSYQENPPISFIQYPAYSDIGKQELRNGYLIMNRSALEMNNTDTMSNGSTSSPPTLPPRSMPENENYPSSTQIHNV